MTVAINQTIQPRYRDLNLHEIRGISNNKIYTATLYKNLTNTLGNKMMLQNLYEG